MRTLHRNLTTVAVTLLAAASLVTAQEPEAVVSEAVDVAEVLLDIVVTDGSGNVVLGLGKEDFIVEEDGEAVELNSVSFYSHHRFLESLERAEELGIDTDAVSVNRHFVLFFHDQRRLLPRLGARQLDAGRRARQWVANDLEPSDWVAVVAYDSSLKVLQDFTNDKEHLDEAIQSAVQGRDPNPAAATRQPDGAPSLVGRFSADSTKIRRIYDALAVVARSTAHIRGRKNLALFSIGFGDVNRFGFYTPDRRYYPDMERTLNDSNVAVYPIDLIPSSDFYVFDALSNALSSLAADTGGKYYSNFVNFLTPLEQMSADSNGYYLLSYSARGKGESGYQAVDVDTKNPDFRVRARQGYIRTE